MAAFGRRAVHHHISKIRPSTFWVSRNPLFLTPQNGGTKIWNAKTKEFYYLLTHHIEAVSQIAICPDELSRLITTCSWDQTINFYKIPERIYFEETDVEEGVFE